MMHLAAVGPDHRLHAFRPLPARLEHQASGGRAAAGSHYIHASLRRRARLIRSIEIERLNTSHGSLLGLVASPKETLMIAAGRSTLQQPVFSVRQRTADDLRWLVSRAAGCGPQTRCSR